MTDIASRGYSNPDVLVSTDWVADHLDDASIRIVESNEDQLPLPVRAHHRGRAGGLGGRPERPAAA